MAIVGKVVAKRLGRMRVLQERANQHQNVVLDVGREPRRQAVDDVADHGAVLDGRREHVLDHVPHLPALDLGPRGAPEYLLVLVHAAPRAYRLQPLVSEVDARRLQEERSTQSERGKKKKTKDLKINTQNFRRHIQSDHQATAMLFRYQVDLCYWFVRKKGKTKPKQCKLMMITKRLNEVNNDERRITRKEKKHKIMNNGMS